MQQISPAKSPVYIGVAWPYANGPLHLGHVAGSLLPPDIFRRYTKMAGHQVLMVSGSDCHGTPIMLKAEKEGKTPAEVVAHFHTDHKRALERLGIGFDLFTTTTTDNHRDLVQKVFLACREMGYIEVRTQKAPYDAKAGRFLPDRYVEGTCPHCARTDARGDQCDGCGKTLDPQELVNPVSKLNPGSPITFRDTDHFYFLLSKLQPALERYVAATAGHWRANTINFTNNWLKEGLQDRAITRDLTWGIPIPLPGYDDKRIYVWFEAVCGYLSASIEWAKRGGKPDEWHKFWTDRAAKGYYFLGKDNIPFHTIIWPGILLAYNESRAKHGERPLNLPFDVPANEFLNLDGKQFSKSRGVSIAVHDVLDRFQSDAVRYYLSMNMPEGRDSDWTWDDFRAKVNDELVGTLGNLIQRVVSFAAQKLQTIPAEPAAGHKLTKQVEEALTAATEEMALHLGSVRLRPGIRRLMELASLGNQWMQESQPWAKIKTDAKGAADDLHALLRLCRGLSVLMAPYLPEAAGATWHMLGESGSVHDQPWSAATGHVKVGAKLELPTILFKKLEASDIPQDVAAPATPTKPQIAQNDPASAKSAKSVAPVVAAGPITIEEFQRIQLRLAVVKSVEAHPKADKLFVLKLDAGDLGERQVVAGLKAYYKPEELVGKTVAFVANLQPAILRGVESQGMVLAADDGTTVAVLEPQRKLPAGSKIR